VGPRASLDTEATGKIPCLCRGSNPDRPIVQSVVRHYSRLGGVVVSVLATGPKCRRFEPGQGDGFLRAIKKSAAHLPLGWEVKPEVPCRKILRHVKEILKSHGDE
jgi:hypothetical protein